MQRVYMRSNEHFEVFTTVLAPRGRYRFRAEAEKMVAVHSYRPNWPDELALSAGDVILVLSKHEEERWLGRLQSGQRGYFPASCVMEQSQVSLPAKALRGSSPPPPALTSSTCHQSGVRARRPGTAHILHALRRGSKGGGAAAGGGGRGDGGGLDGGQGEYKGPVPVRRPQVPQPLPAAPQPRAHPRSLGLLHRILSKCRRRSESQQGATNGAFEGD